MFFHQTNHGRVTTFIRMKTTVRLLLMRVSVAPVIVGNITSVSTPVWLQLQVIVHHMDVVFIIASELSATMSTCSANLLS